MKRVQSSKTRGTTVVEILISTGILLIVLGFSAVLFRQAFTHHTLTTENMSNEQQARLALARINSSLSQASVEANPSDFPSAPAPPIITSATPFPTTTSASAISFYRVASLDPAAMPSPGGAPIPSYDVHIISYDPVGQTVDEFVIDEPSYAAGSPSPSPLIIAQHVTAFGITSVTPLEYQFQITINDVVNPTETEQPKTLIDNVHLLK